MQTLIEKIQAILYVTGWSQDQLAVELGVSQATVSRWISTGQDPRGKNRDQINALYDKHCAAPPDWKGMLSEAIVTARAQGVQEREILRKITEVLDEIERQNPEDMKLVSEVAQRVRGMKDNQGGEDT